MDAPSAIARQRVYVFQHAACEDLGTFAEVLAERGLRAEYVRLFSGDPVPEAWTEARALIVLGGPMSTSDESHHPYLSAEKALLRRALQEEMPILGVCLGSQLLAAAAGSRVYPGARPEIGWEPLSLTLEGRQDPVLSPLAQLAAVFHWHGETFDLPAHAVRLAFSALTMNQAFRLGRSAYGLQFHLEVTQGMIDAWVQEYSQDLEPDIEGAVGRIAADTALYATALRTVGNEAMHRFLDCL